MSPIAIDEVAFLTGGGVCNGAGVVINATQPACACFPMYNGAADMFDTRLGDSGLSLGCSNFRPAEIAVWSVVLAALLYRLYKVASMFAEKVRRFKQTNKSWRLALKNFSIRLLATDMATFFPPLAIVCLLKIAGAGTIGTDVLITLCYAFTVAAFQLSHAMLAGEEFYAITDFLPPHEKRQVRAFRHRLDIAAWTVHMVGVAGPFIMVLALDKSKGPIVGNLYHGLLISNCAMVLWCAICYFANNLVFHRLEQACGATPSDSKPAQVLNQMKRANVALGYFYLLIALIFAIFCIPQLWAFQTYMYSLVWFFGALSHPANAFLTEAQVLKHSPSNSNDPTKSSKNQGVSQHHTNNAQVHNQTVVASMSPRSSTNGAV